MRALALALVLPVLSGCSNGSSAAADRIAIELDAGRIELPSPSGGPLRIFERASGIAVAVDLRSAAPITWRATSTGAEDFVELAHPIERDRVVYRVGLDRAAGLRVVANVLEILDDDGVPRVRASAPSIKAADGTTRAASASIEGCAFDSDPRPPWGRSTVPPGARSCDLVVRWDGRGLSYPIVVDPGWSFTKGNLVTPRWLHTLTPLSNGTVLVAGGSATFTGGSSPAIPDAEIYDPKLDVFTPTGPLTAPRLRHVATPLADGTVLITGGASSEFDFTASGALASTEVYDPMTGKSAAVGPLGAARYSHTATLLQSGDVLVAGGADDANVLYTSEVFHAGAFSPGPAMIWQRLYHSATLLDDGSVFLAGGCLSLGTSGCSATTSATEIFSAGSFAPGPDLSHPRASHAAAKVNGLVVLAEGTLYVGDNVFGVKSTEVFDGAAISAGPVPATAAYTPSAHVLASGRVLVVGDSNVTDELDVTSMTAIPGPPVQTARYDAQAADLPGGEVLLAGGHNGMSVLEPRAERLKFVANGSACKADIDCASGLCDEATGVCCATLCDQTCHACVAGTGACTPVLSGDDADTCTGPAKACDANGACKSQLGEACATAAECLSGSCADGVCCDKTCGGQCEYCALAIHPGVCSAVTGAPRGGRPACGGDVFCGGACDGTSKDCAFAPLGIVCEHGCTDSTVSVGTCDGKGSCACDGQGNCPGNVAPAACPGNFKCLDAQVCRTSCSGPSDCIDGYACTKGACVPDTPTCENGHIRSLPDGTKQDCAPYTCDADGACRTSCRGADQCVNPNVCDAKGACIPSGAAASDTGCSCRGAGEGSAGGGEWMLCVLAVIATARRRRSVR